MGSSTELYGEILLSNGGGEDEGHCHTPPSLIISPNLEALLEYDERIRRVAGPHSPEGDSSQSTELTPTSPVGLPPPPRGRRKPHPQTSPRAEGGGRNSWFHHDPGVTSLPTSPVASGLSTNPYINPAPSLAELRQATDNPRRALSMSVTVLPEIQEHDAGVEAGPRDAGRSPVDTVDGRNDLQQPSVSQPSTSRLRLDKYRVDKFLNIGKIPFSLFTDPTAQKTQLNDVSNSPSPITLPSQLPSNLRERARAKGKLLKLKDTTTAISEMHRLGAAEAVLDIRRQGSAPGAYQTAERGVIDVIRRGPLISHESWQSSSSQLSSDSEYSNSSGTHGPASTDEPRISISSTAYPASSAHSHTRSMYHATDQLPIVPPHRTSSLTHSSPIRRTPSNVDHESFIEMLSPTNQGFTLDNEPTSLTPTNAAPQPAIYNYHHAFRSHSQPQSRSSSPKPPIPTAPKPIFSRLSPKTSPQLRYPVPKNTLDSLPPTTNFLDLDERSGLIRKNRKLARVFGQTPGADVFSHQDCARSQTTPPTKPGTADSRHHRGALSMSNNLEISAMRNRPPPIWPPAVGTQYMSASGRRYSTPNLDDFSFLGADDGSLFNPNEFHIEVGSQEGVPSSDTDHHAADQIGPASPMSFIDLSDDPGSAIIATAKKAGRGRPSSPSSQSLFENMTPEEKAEEERRRKREKLAKLHRFLGSRVPTNLVLGLDDSTASLPLPLENNMTTPENEEASRKAWLRRRRSSSAAAFSSTWSDETDRVREDLDDKEKAINVRRAHKMEKVFGIAPPQTLYHTRRSPSPSLRGAAIVLNHKLGTGRPSGYPSAGDTFLPLSGQRNPNQSAYTKPRSKAGDRPGTSESNKHLLPKGENSYDLDDPINRRTDGRRTSIVYTHYQHSLNSLSDIIDRDDKQSLVELHEYLNGGDMTAPPPLQDFTRASDRRLSSASSIKSERRRSLPARTSMVSISSEYSISTPRPEVSDFQARRRKAAKLTQFFGVDYRDLISDVLESIEHGLEHERKRGTMRPEEVEDLLQRLRNLRTKREGIF